MECHRNCRTTKSILVLVIFIWCLFVETSLSMADELVGVVLSVDEQVPHMVVAETSPPGSEENKRLITVSLPKQMIFKRPNGRLLPGWARVGNTVGVGGYYTDKNRQLFVMTRGHHRLMRHRHDPTGVRNRIGRGCRPMFPKPPGDQDEHKETSDDKKDQVLVDEEKSSSNSTGESGK